MPCSPVKVNRSFRVTYCLYRQGVRVSQARNKSEAVSNQSLLSFFAYSLALKMETICYSETLLNFHVSNA
jgi:hypothetical protein